MSSMQNIGYIYNEHTCRLVFLYSILFYLRYMVLASTFIFCLFINIISIF